MRTLIFALILFSMPVCSYAQHFSIIELIELNRKNWNDFDTYVINKGYEFQLTNQESNYEQRNYAVDANNSGQARYFISKTIWKNISTKYISYQTVNPKDYLSIKNELKNLKFTYIKSDVWDKYTVFYYKKAEIQIEIYVKKSETSSGKMITGYEITLGFGLSGFDNP